MVLNGPNLSRLGSRQVDIYGLADLGEVSKLCFEQASLLGFGLDFFSSNEESDLLAWIYGAIDAGCHVIINPAAFTHYSYALRDAALELVGAKLFLLEVHLSNPDGRESFRRVNVFSGVATGSICGFGIDSYRLALLALDKLVG